MSHANPPTTPHAAPTISRRTLPAEPLLRAAGGWTGVARALGYRDFKDMHRHTNVFRYERSGLSWVAADQMACALNLHPFDVWGDDWFACTGTPLGVPPRLRREPRWGLIGAELAAS